MKNKILPSLLCLAALSCCSISRATLIGDTISASGYQLAPGSATIGAGVEFVSAFSSTSFDFGPSTLTLIAPSWGGGVFGSTFYVFSGFDETITGVSIGSNGGWSGTILNPQFDAHSITLDMSSAFWTNDSLLVFDLQTSSSVPDAGSSVLLFGIGLTGLAAARRKLRS